MSEVQKSEPFVYWADCADPDQSAMCWHKETWHLHVSDQGYKIGIYRAAGVTYYRPSLKGDFIARPFTDLDAAKAECDRHFEGGGK